MRVPVHVQKRTDTIGPTSDLGKQIQQIVAQEGHFRHITEESLLAKGDDLADSHDDSKDNEASGEEDETPQKRMEKLAVEKQEMQGSLIAAQLEILSAIDFVSFLLSKHSAVAMNSMSPDLKTRIIPGTLDAQVVPFTPMPDTRVRQMNNVSRSWKSKAFAASSKSLSKASADLQAEAQRESQFWEQVSSVKEAGWPVSRHPRDSRAIGVHFGMTESAPQFRSRGFALLRQSESSDLFLDRPEAPKRRKRLHVRIIRNGNQTADRPVTSTAEHTESSILRELLEARNDLFEEELLHEIGGEARLAANQGITSRGESVVLTVEDDLRVQVYSRHAEDSAQVTSTEDADLADYVSVSLQNLLLAAHKSNRVRRSRAPPPLSIKPASRPEYAIVRPILTNLRHGVEMLQIRSSIASALEAPCAAAGLRMEVKSTWDDQQDPNATKHTLSASSTIKFNLASGHQPSCIVTTNLGHPVYGTVYDVSEIDFSLGLLPATRLQNQRDTMQALAHAVTLTLILQISRIMTFRPRYEEITLKNMDTGEVVISGPESKFNLRVGLMKGILVLGITDLNVEDGKGKRKLLRSWSANGNSSVGKASLAGLKEEGYDKELPFPALVDQLMRYEGHE